MNAEVIRRLEQSFTRDDLGRWTIAELQIEFAKLQEAMLHAIARQQDEVNLARERSNALERAMHDMARAAYQASAPGKRKSSK
jgi:hypothetical protein